MGCINTNLLSLKVLLFCFFGGLGCLYPFLSLHMKHVGLRPDDIAMIQLVVSFVTVVGAPIVGLVADKTGRHKAILLVTVLLTAIFYAALLLVPKVQRLERRHPAVHLNCTDEGSAVVQERCMNGCFQGSEGHSGDFTLIGCRYECWHPFHTADSSSRDRFPDEEVPIVRRKKRKRRDEEDEDLPELEDDFPEYGSGDEDVFRPDPPVDLSPPSWLPHQAPHFCFEGDGFSECKVYTNYTGHMSFRSSLARHIDRETECLYPLVTLTTSKNNRFFMNLRCRPLPSGCWVRCNIKDPYLPGAILEHVECYEGYGSPDWTFWTYLFCRTLGETMAVASTALLVSAVLSMTHEYKGDLGKELLWGSVGLGTFAPLVGYLLDSSLLDVPYLGLPFALCFLGLAGLLLMAAMLTAALPLHPEWRARSLGRSLGRLLCCGEVLLLFLILVLLGSLHGLLDDTAPWHLLNMKASKLLLGLTLSVGMLPALLFMWRVERVVDYCGYANLLIIAFIFYILRFSGYAYLENPWLCLIMEVMEVFTLTLMWATASLYMYHLTPRALLATGQSLATICHFSLGRGFGAVVAMLAIPAFGQMQVYKMAAAVSAVLATAYLFLYYTCVRLQGCRRTRHLETYGETPLVNGTYTPLRVFHNGKGKSGFH